MEHLFLETSKGPESHLELERDFMKELGLEPAL